MGLSRLEKWMMTNPLRAWVQRRYEAPYLFEGVEPPPGATCLEIGCGWGMGALLIAEVVSATVTWRTDLPFVRVYALDERGQRRREIPVQEAPGGVTFTLGGKHRTLWYDLVTGTKVYLPFVGCDCLVGGE